MRCLPLILRYLRKSRHLHSVSRMNTRHMSRFRRVRRAVLPIRARLCMMRPAYFIRVNIDCLHINILQWSCKTHIYSVIAFWILGRRSSGIFHHFPTSGRFSYTFTLENQRIPSAFFDLPEEALQLGCNEFHYFHHTGFFHELGLL